MAQTGESRNPRLLTKREYAAYWRVSEKTVDDWTATGRVVPLRTPGGAPRFELGESLLGRPDISN